MLYIVRNKQKQKWQPQIIWHEKGFYRKSAFSAPKIWTVDAGHLARFVKEPAFWINLAATVSPIKVLKLGATVDIFSSK